MSVVAIANHNDSTCQESMFPRRTPELDQFLIILAIVQLD